LLVLFPNQTKALAVIYDEEKARNRVSLEHLLFHIGRVFVKEQTDRQTNRQTDKQTDKQML